MILPAETEPPGCPDCAKLNCTATSERKKRSKRVSRATTSGGANAGSARSISIHSARLGPKAWLVVWILEGLSWLVIGFIEL